MNHGHSEAPMDPATATMIAEGEVEADEETTVAAWQYLVDTGLAWKLQGYFGRAAARLIDTGVIKRFPRTEEDEDSNLSDKRHHDEAEA